MAFRSMIAGQHLLFAHSVDGAVWVLDLRLTSVYSAVGPSVAVFDDETAELVVGE